MQTIYRFQLHLVDEPQHLPVRIGSRPLLVAVRGRGRIDVWFEVDTDRPVPAPERMAAVVVGTGHPLPIGRRQHLGSVVDEPFVWHLYEVTV